MASSTPTHQSRPAGVLARCTATVSGPVRIVVARVVDGLLRLTEQLFANADDYFFDMANRAESSEDQAAYFEAMRLIRLQRSALASQFFDDLAQAIADCWRQAGTGSTGHAEADEKLDFDEITLQSDSEIEVSSALSMISSRGQALYGHQIARLTETINSVSECPPLDDATNPLGIRSLSHRFADAAAALELSPRALARLLMLFERDVTEKLGNIYKQALEEVAQAGVTIVEPKREQPAGHEARATRDFQQPDEGAMEFEELRSYLSPPATGGTYGASGHAATGISGSSVVVTAAELVNALSIAQTKYLDHMPAPGAAGPGAFPNLQQFLVATPSDQGGFQQASQTELDTLKLVSDLFEHIFRNQDISLACMSLIARLQFPVLKIAIVDKTFFGRRDHPARQFLNQLARDGIGWPTSSSLLLKHRLYRFAEELVTEINDVFSSDPAVFQRSLEAWNIQVAKKSSQIQTAERRINETELGKAKLNAARSIVERVVNRNAGRTLPRAVCTFICDHWSQVLVMTCIRFGTRSEEWRNALGVLNDLLGISGPAGRPGSAAAERDGQRERLMTFLEQGMLQSGLTGSAHMDALAAVTATLEHQAIDQAELITMEPVSIADGHSPRARKTLDPRLERLVLGTWIEVRASGDEGPLRCRLVVLVDQTQTYVFASDDGLKVYERSVKALLEELEAGTVRILTEEPLVERAMTDLVDGLRDD